MRAPLSRTRRHISQKKSKKRKFFRASSCCNVWWPSQKLQRSILSLCIAASRNGGDYRRVSRVVTTYRVRHEQRTFLLGKKRPQAPFPFSFSFLLSRTAANQSATAEDARRGRCRGLFRDRGSFDFRETRRIVES